ncbi:DedA family protein [Xinfangfangia sp. D13-10-4-6]|uniref:YqaA family protein n=1 Tax=Pseudogemmobacter hezensis TaxID=2737662 RepID=UPI001552252D|nr:YqaA family protein [Pseudogemmobacter hezensis]NPD14552.1 DedA family protein [Pseudogemmobacter hezensis]
MDFLLSLSLSLGPYGLALAAFIAATPLPMNSEVVFIALQAAGQSPLMLVLVASAANILGSCVTYWCGLQGERLRGSRWFPFTDQGLVRARAWFSRWGLWSLLLAWAPGGDLIVALAGLMRVNPLVFLALTTIAKTARYTVLALIGAGLLGG